MSFPFYSLPSEKIPKQDLFKMFLMFSYFERERESARERRGGEEREREREIPKQALYCQCIARRRPQTQELQDHDLS